MGVVRLITVPTVSYILPAAYVEWPGSHEFISHPPERPRRYRSH